MNPRILVVGSANMDLVLNMERIPYSGETVMEQQSYDFMPGGKGANAAVAAARLGGDVIFCAMLGSDTHASVLLDCYEKERLDTRFIKQSKTSRTGLAAIMVEKNGTNRIVVYPGANFELSEDEVEHAFLSYPDALLIQFELDGDLIAAAIGYAKAHKVPVFIDAGPYNKKVQLGALQNVEVFSPNERETCELTGIEPRDTDSCLRACTKLSELVTSKFYVLKISDRGSFIYDGKYCEYVPSYDVTAVDTTAAGDAFTAALTLEYLRSRNIVRACKYANIAGALAVTKRGAVNSLPTYKEVEAFRVKRRIEIQ